MKRLLKLPETPIAMILIVDDVNMPTPSTIFADDRSTTKLYHIDELQEMLDNGEITKLRRILDDNNLLTMFHLTEDSAEFNYTFTQKQRDRLSKIFESYHDETINRKLEVPQLLDFVQRCDNCSIPIQRKNPDEAYKNFAKYNHLRLAPEDYIAIIRKFEYGDYQGCIRSFYPDFWGNKIFQFRRNDEYFNSVNESIGQHNLWMEINIRKSYDNDNIALISMHDAETSEHME